MYSKRLRPQLASISAPVPRVMHPRHLVPAYLKSNAPRPQLSGVGSPWPCPKVQFPAPQFPGQLPGYPVNQRVTAHGTTGTGGGIANGDVIGGDHFLPTFFLPFGAQLRPVRPPFCFRPMASEPGQQGSPDFFLPPATRFLPLLPQCFTGIPLVNTRSASGWHPDRASSSYFKLMGAKRDASRRPGHFPAAGKMVAHPELVPPDKGERLIAKLLHKG